MMKTLGSGDLRVVAAREPLEAENLALRHRVNVLRRSAPPRMRLHGNGRLRFVWFYRLRPAPLMRTGPASGNSRPHSGKIFFGLSVLTIPITVWFGG